MIGPPPSESARMIPLRSACQLVAECFCGLQRRRNVQSKFRSRARTTLDIDRSTQGVEEFFDHIEPEAKTAAHHGGIAALHLAEAFKDACQLIRRDAHAGIRDLYLQELFCC